AAVSAKSQRRGRLAMTVATLVIGLGLWAGHGWWQSEAQAYASYVYKPLTLDAKLAAGSPASLDLALEDPGWLRGRRPDHLVADHDHVMHLFVVRLPALDRVWHLHPEPLTGGRFLQKLPTMPAGRYQLFADVVHASGLYETATAEIGLSEFTGTELSGDDAA